MMAKGAKLQAGVSRAIITPPRGIYLIGYGHRSKGNRGVHDDLTATTLVLDDGQQRLALVALDLLCLNEYIVDRLREAAGCVELLVCCSHTHSGPIAYADRSSPRANRAYVDYLVDCVLYALKEAESNLLPVRLSWVQSEANIAINRRERQPDGSISIGRNPQGPVDKSLQVINIMTLNGSRLAMLVNFACHGTVLGPDNLLVSADWIGAMRARVENELGGRVLFLQGATGDLNPDMFWNDICMWEKMQSEGERLAAAVISACYGGVEAIPEGPLSLVRKEAWLPLELPATTPKPPKGYRKPLLAMAGLPSWMSFLTDALLDRRYPWKSRIVAFNGFWSIPLRINIARIGDLALVTFAAEVFTEIGMTIKAYSPARHTLFASLTDGCIGYLTTSQASNQGGYEVDIAPFPYRYPGRFSSHCDEIAIEAARQALDVLWQ